ncbi:MAG: small multi-drug export protein [Nanoarchaeota archaeon]|nr:small multi-drug export protein [Nanoarchaeota archaeon]MBU1005554.1 small multi-drug export protein [Nanoarchaeota archaeon]MBU1946043.1 small multi-drug export protein [Nanoarchaeota archaeon]
MNSWLFLLLLAVAPISELRGAIPYGIIKGLPLIPVILISIIANIIAGILVYFFLDKIVHLFFNWGFFKRYYHKFIERAQKKIHAQVEKYGWIGVALFVGIPLPITGAWTGALGSYLIGLEKKKAIAAIILGVLMASIIVTIVMLTGAEIFQKLFIKVI